MRISHNRTGQIMRCEKSGCETPIVIVRGLSLPKSIATDGTNVYWSESADAGRIAKCPVAGCDMPTTLAANRSVASNLVVDAWNVYFASVDAGGDHGQRLPGSQVATPC